MPRHWLRKGIQEPERPQIPQSCKYTQTLQELPISPILTYSSMVTTTNSYTTTRTVHSRLLTLKHQRLTPDRSAWRKRSPTGVKCVASGIRTWTASNITSRIHHRAIPSFSSWPVAVSTLAEVSCRDRISTLPGLASLALARRVFYKLPSSTASSFIFVSFCFHDSP